MSDIIYICGRGFVWYDIKLGHERPATEEEVMDSFINETITQGHRHQWSEILKPYPKIYRLYRAKLESKSFPVRISTSNGRFFVRDWQGSTMYKSLQEAIDNGLRKKARVESEYA